MVWLKAIVFILRHGVNNYIHMMSFLYVFA